MLRMSKCSVSVNLARPPIRFPDQKPHSTLRPPSPVHSRTESLCPLTGQGGPRDRTAGL